MPAGLDSTAALAVIEHLIALTNAGHTIACSIHQPRQEIFAAFDKVLIMSEGRQVGTTSHSTRTALRQQASGCIGCLLGQSCQEHGRLPDTLLNSSRRGRRSSLPSTRS